MDAQRNESDSVEWLVALALGTLLVIFGIPALVTGVCAYSLFRFVWWGLASNRGLHRQRRK